MYRFLFRPRWLGFHALVVAAVVVMVNLGFWQLRRLDERREFNATVEERLDAPVVPLTDLLTELDADPAADPAADPPADPPTDPETIEWRTVTASGTYLPDQVVLFNRTRDGRTGDHVLTPLQLADGPIVLVDRGFVAIGTEPPPPPTSTVEVLGRVRPGEGDASADAAATGDDPVTGLRRVDIGRIAPQLSGPVAPVYLVLVDADPPPGPADPLPARPPELNQGPHLSYAVQWFVFSIAVAVGWVLAVRRSLAGRRGEVTAGSPGPGSGGSPSPAAAGSASSPTRTGGASSG